MKICENLKILLVIRVLTVEVTAVAVDDAAKKSEAAPQRKGTPNLKISVESEAVLRAQNRRRRSLPKKRGWRGRCKATPDASLSVTDASQVQATTEKGEIGVQSPTHWPVERGVGPSAAAPAGSQPSHIA